MPYYCTQHVHCGLSTCKLCLIFIQREWDKFCEVQGFLFQYFTSVELLFLVSMCLVLFFEMLKVITASRLVKYYEKANESTSICMLWLEAQETRSYNFHFIVQSPTHF